MVIEMWIFLYGYTIGAITGWLITQSIYLHKAARYKKKRQTKKREREGSDLM